ncbi:MAG TPA: cobalamin-dependent protein, partial [Candidatus Limnocylindrales bacterium]|nr:cobalamin-dependent protein [Candidatus Limnocylindrales bacterium]
MAREKLDLLLVQPGNRSQVYQGLGSTLSAIEPPVWAGLLATFARARGYSVDILDAEAMELTPDAAAAEIARRAPVLTAVVVFGHQPSASTQTMAGASTLCTALKRVAPHLPTLVVGGHVSALPERTMREEDCHFVCQGEGPHTMVALLEALATGAPRYDRVPGLWYREGGVIRSTTPAPLIDDLDRDLPGMAWDLLPMARYRAHNWHCFGHLDRRQPYASIYTSLGCPFKCTFCCINSPFGKPSYRF